MSTAELTDEQLHRRWLDGDLSAFDRLYARHAQALFGFLRRQLGDAAEAEDVLHEAFLSLLREGRSGRAVRTFRPWLFQVARNLCHNRRRSLRRAADAVQVMARGPSEPVEAAEALLEAREARAALAEAVGRLPAPLAELYHLRVSGLSYEEIAEVQAVPLGTVKSRLHDLVARMREEIEPWAATTSRSS